MCGLRFNQQLFCARVKHAIVVTTIHIAAFKWQRRRALVGVVAKWIRTVVTIKEHKMLATESGAIETLEERM